MVPKGEFDYIILVFSIYVPLSVRKDEVKILIMQQFMYVLPQTSFSG